LALPTNCFQFPFIWSVFILEPPFMRNRAFENTAQSSRVPQVAFAKAKPRACGALHIPLTSRVGHRSVLGSEIAHAGTVTLRLLF
jgi:hypothetical protein